MSETPWWLEDDDEIADPLTEAQTRELHGDMLTLRCKFDETA